MNVPRVEPDLSQSTPRHVRLRTPWSIWFIRIGSAVPAIFTYLFVASAAKCTWEFVSFSVLGRSVKGEVVAKFITPGVRDAHFVDYTYSLDGQNYTGRARVSDKVYSTTAMADSFPLQTDFSSPRTSRRAIGTGFELLAVLISWAIAAVPTTIFLGCVRLAYYRPWIQGRLVRFGHVTAAVVTKIDSGEDKTGKWFRIGYEYRPRTNGREEVLDGTVDARGPDAEAIQVGDPLAVIYDPRLPARNVVYRFSDYQVLNG